MCKKTVFVVLSFALSVLLDLQPAYGAYKEGELAIKKIPKAFCAAGFKAYVKHDKKNICARIAATSGTAYSCVWDEMGDTVNTGTIKGPCNLDFTEYRGNIFVIKTDYTSYPPISYAAEAQCCVRTEKISTSRLGQSPI